MGAGRRSNLPYCAPGGVARLIVGERLVAIVQVEARVEHEVTARKLQLRELGALAPHHDETVLTHVVELAAIVDLAAGVGGEFSVRAD